MEKSTELENSLTKTLPTCFIFYMKEILEMPESMGSVSIIMERRTIFMTVIGSMM